MLYYTKQELLSAIQLAKEELQRGTADKEDIAYLLEECSEMVGREADRIRGRVNRDRGHNACQRENT